LNPFIFITGFSISHFFCHFHGFKKRAVATLFSFPFICGYAAEEARASVPVILTVTNEYRSINVTVPASFPIKITNGTVITATNAKISNNNKYGDVKVTSVNVMDGDYKIGNYNSFSGKKTVALKLNGIPTKSAGRLEITDNAFPVIKPQNDLPIKYFAKVSGDANNVSEKEIAQVVFTISIVD